ncbi:MAG: DUF3891 family protein [Chloroflexota bacterium]
MIIQTAPENVPNQVILQTDHAAMSGQFAAAFGNVNFMPLAPRAPMVYVAAHHDDGWTAIDALVEQNAQTGLPHHLTQTPLPYLVETSSGSPAANEAYHPYSGILSSMHTYGLFNGRYGLSDKVFIDLIPAEHKASVQTMLDAELMRQERLKSELREDAETAVWVTDEMLFHNYKLLQFFDTLALYFHTTYYRNRGETHFLNVPRAVGEDVTLTIKRIQLDVYTLDPYPFKQPTMAFTYTSKPMLPQPAGTNLKALLAETEAVVEEVVIVKES